MFKQEILQGEAAAEGAVLCVLDYFAAYWWAFTLGWLSVFADNGFFLVIGGVADVGGGVVCGKEVGRFDKPEQVGGEVAKQFLFVSIWSFIFSQVLSRWLFFAAHFHQCGAQAAFECATRDEWRVVVRVGGGAFDFQLVGNFFAVIFMLGDLSETFFIFIGYAQADTDGIFTVVGNFDKGHWVFAKIFLNPLNVTCFCHLKQFVSLCFVEAVIGMGRVKGVESIGVNAVLFDDVIGRLVVFASAEVDGRKRGEVQGVAVEEVCHGVFLLEFGLGGLFFLIYIHLSAQGVCK